jgi:HAD superfamily hydrolase (TIGR01549 family)
MKYEALLFDFDDCLFDTYDDRTRTTVVTLHENGYPDATWEVAHRELGGETAYRFMKTAGVEDLEEGERLGKLWDKTNLRDGYQTAQPFPGVTETLEALTEYPMGIFSASLSPVVRGVLERVGMSKFFAGVVGKETLPEQKPSPRGLFLLCRQIGVEPSKCLYAGDTPGDIRAGKAAGMKTFAVTYGLGAIEALEKEGPDFLAGDFRDLLAVVEKGL